MATRWFLWFRLRACGTHRPTPRFLNLAHWMQMSHNSGMVTAHHICHFPNTLTWNIVDMFKWTSLRSCWTWSVTNVTTILLNTRIPFSCHALSNGIVHLHGTNVSCRPRCFCPSIELKEKNMLEMFQFLHLALHFLASMAPLTIFKWQNFNT